MSRKKSDVPKRQQWMISRVAESFGLGEAQVTRSFKREEALDKLAEFSHANGPRRIFVFYQPRVDPLAPPEEDVAEKTDAEPNTFIPGLESELFLTWGNQEPVLSKACYFLRMDATGTGLELNMDLFADEDLLFGELGTSASVDVDATDPKKQSAQDKNPPPPVLSDLETLIEVLFSKGLRQMTTSAWGPNSEDRRDEVLGDVDSFAVELRQTIKSRSRVIDLPLPEEEFLDSPRTHTNKEIKKGNVGSTRGSSYGNKVDSYESKRLQHYAALLVTWCETVEADLQDIRNSEKKHGTDSALGPASEIEYWRRRVQRLTNLAEQIQLPKCQNVVRVVALYSKETDVDQKRSMGMDPSDLIVIIRRWKTIDLTITEYINEAMDNEKYLKTLDKFIGPLYNPDPAIITEMLSPLMNSIKMIYTIARYYNTEERMTNFFQKITYQMIYVSCGHILKCCQKDKPKPTVEDMKKKKKTTGGSGNGKKQEEEVTEEADKVDFSFKKGVVGASFAAMLWDAHAEKLVLGFQVVLQLNEAFHAAYTETKIKLENQQDQSKQFNFSEQEIFGLFDVFCRRVIKLVDMFEIIKDFQSLEAQKIEGMEKLNQSFHKIVANFRNKKHNLLEFQNSKFDRDFVEFNVKIGKLEGQLLEFVNKSFENVTNIKHSLKVLNNFKRTLKRDSVISSLDEKMGVIFKQYGNDLEQVQVLYEKHKQAPPMPRNMPPVAGNITWSRHLLKRIEGPMKSFETNPSILSTREGKKIVKMYNKVARTLVAFEYLWYKAWTESIETSRAGLQATLIIRHPEDSKLYINLDPEILQLIREARCLDRIGIEVPEVARIILYQEESIKIRFETLTDMLADYERIAALVIPVTTTLLQPHINDLEYRLRPGMITLTWTSMNIDAFVNNVRNGMHHLEILIRNVNDVIEHRLEKSLKAVSKSLLVELPAGASFTLDEFVDKQEKKIDDQVKNLQDQNLLVEASVEDLVKIISQYPIDSHISGVTQEDIENLRKHYNHFMYQALLNCSKNSLNAIKKRMSNKADPKTGAAGIPFFEVDVQLALPDCQLSPSLDDVQAAINISAKAVLTCNRYLYDWGQSNISKADRLTFFRTIAKDIEIVRVVLLLTGSIQGLRNLVADFLKGFKVYEWLWTEDKDKSYEIFMLTEPNLDDYSMELARFSDTEADIDAIPDRNTIGALQLVTKNIKAQLKHMASMWRVSFSKKLHVNARDQMENLMEYIATSDKWLKRNHPVDLTSLAAIMAKLNEIRKRESTIDAEITPVLEMYEMLQAFLPEGYLGNEELDQITILRSSWRKLIERTMSVSDNLTSIQHEFRGDLLKDIKHFKKDLITFGKDWKNKGPGVAGLKPAEAVERLRIFKAEYENRERKQKLYKVGEELYAFQVTEYPGLTKIKKEMAQLDTLYGLYVDVHESLEVSWPDLPWQDVMAEMEVMQERMDGFTTRVTKMPRALRSWDAYADLKKKIEDFNITLPLLQHLSKPSVKPRHWTELMEITGTQFRIDGDFRLENLLECNLAGFEEDIEELTDGADKQLAIEKKVEEIEARWSTETFTFMDWKARRIPVLRATGAIIEELEESQLQCQTMLTMRHVKPFREEVSTLLTRLSDTTDTLERWLKVQMLWCSLESVFTGGDIAKQMPVEAKKFHKVDKEWGKMMIKSQQTELVFACTEDEVLRENLPPMFSELEACQRALEGYLEKKRNRFPRFYFCSNPVLLQVLSQGSNPQMVQPYYQNVFDAIDHVVHDEENPKLVNSMVSRFKGQEEEIMFSSPVMAKGNIEEWLANMKVEQQVTMKELCRKCAEDADQLSLDPVEAHRHFVDEACPQYALLGIQLTWTSECTDAFENMRSKKGAISDVCKRAAAVLKELSGWCLEELTKMIRTKYETLITIQVHQRDVLDNINSLFRQKNFSGSQDFTWLQQARFYWRPEEEDDIDDDGAMRIVCTDAEFDYQYEYLGCKGRLVITPLTDRCYITLSQAMNMCYGGAPAGPAGTGKTETVKDMGRALGIYVIVTNCTDQATYASMGKIFKGLCMSGLWGCFDEFNRIALPVLSVVAQQVLAVLDAKRTGASKLTFPGDPQEIGYQKACGFFVTMNPGYAGRQELPENLKSLFRGVTMMVPDREIIIRVFLCAKGYEEFTRLSKKFTILYVLCEEQLSKQRHYDFGLRNILAVLRTAGQTKRENRDAPESILLYQTLRDMNLSKMVSQDVPLFLSLLRDLFPKLEAPAVASYPAVEKAIEEIILEEGLVNYAHWKQKVVQLYETHEVRHGIMVIGPTGGGKTQIFNVLRQALARVREIQIREIRLNPKAITAAQMYGEVDPMSDEWTTGVFAAIWTKYNNRENPYSSWIVCDSPVDTFWIEDLNTVLDDNQILTLSNGDRIPMTDNVKIMFENETLINASPATVSRCGIIYVSQSDLGWTPIVQAWAKKGDATEPELLKKKAVLLKQFYIYMGDDETPADAGKMFSFLKRIVAPVMNVVIAGVARACCRMLDGLLAHMNIGKGSNGDSALARIFVYALTWSIGALLEGEDRRKWDNFLREQPGSDENALPQLRGEEDTVYEYFVEDDAPNEWKRWSAPKWNYPKVPHGQKLRFSSLLVPTMDSRRSLYVMSQVQSQGLPVMMTGSQGTAKTSTALMWAETFDTTVMEFKFVNFSSATLQRNFQDSIEESLDKRGGNSFGPPNGKKLTVFVDDISMPDINEWGDQPTNEIVRQLVEFGNFAFLDKDKRGVMKKCDDLVFLAAMTHPGGGRNDIPDRLKSHFLIFNLVPPSLESINDIYGQILGGYYKENKDSDFLELGGVNLDKEGRSVVEKFTKTTIDLWTKVRKSLLPTPAKFHYVFTMRELSRIFQGVLTAPMETANTGGIVVADMKLQSSTILVRLLRHECERVLCDKLTNNKDKDWYKTAFKEVILEHFEPNVFEEETGNITDNYFVDFFREDVFDEDDNLVEAAPKIYEFGGSLENIRSRAEMYMARYNKENPSTPLNLVLFDDALRHMMRITRIIQMSRGNALCVGVGGSGKQSLTKLAAFIARHRLFQIKLTKTYNVTNFGDDLKECMVHAGTIGPVTFLFTDAQIKKETFLEYINGALLTGDVPGLFTKEEMMGATAEVSGLFAKTFPGEDSTPARLRQFFIDIVRDRLHMVLCMSPANAKFPKRARKFPGIISGCTINWFLSWPQDALVAVSRGFIGDFEVECTDAEKEELMIHMGEVHNMATKVCDEYFQSMRRNVYQTPKSFLSFLADFKVMYGTKLAALKKKAANIELGLEKLEQGGKDVAAMKIVLAGKQIELEHATEATNKMLASLEISSAEALKEQTLVAGIAESCDSDRNRIAGEKELCMTELAKAQPYVDDANKAIDSIKQSDIGEVKVLKKPSDIIRLIFDCVLLLFYQPLNPVVPLTLIIKKQEVSFLTPSWEHALPFMAQSGFLKTLQWFGNGSEAQPIAGKDMMNAETIELLSPYINLENFNAATAKSASNAAEGLCKFCVAMKFYYEASKLIAPKLEALQVAEGQLAEAEKKLAEASERLDKVNSRLAELTATFEAQMAEKTRIEDGAKALERKMDMASQLINGLSGERVRWAEDSKLFGQEMKQLIGDCAVACAFVSYCGAFNQEYRLMMINDRFRADCVQRNIPVSPTIEVTEFLVEPTVIGEWNLQGLPTDILSTQNGILVTRSSRFPLMIDPQAQAINWIRNKEEDRLPPWKETNISNNKLKDQLEFCMSEGKAMIVVGIEEEIDPLLDPVMQKEIVKKGRSYYITVADQQMDYDPNFMCYFVTRLPKPHFSPELQAMTTVVDFAVTRLGLEDQLLGIVIGQEQKALQDQLQEVLQECNNNRRTLDQLDAELLDRLSSGSGNLLDDTELVGVLNETKKKANDVKAALIAAVETRESINVKREQFRPVATRGSVMYFSIVETSQINVMYQTSLQQFLDLFLRSMAESEPARIASKRVDFISEYLTYLAYRYINRGLYEEHKLTFVFIVTLKVLVVAKVISQADVGLLLQGGAALNINTAKKKPYVWLSDEAWLNVVEVSQKCQFYRDLAENMTRNESAWRGFYEENAPEKAVIPDYATAIDGDRTLGAWHRLLIVRTLRVDRSMLAIKDFIKLTEQIGPKYVEPVTDTLESIYDEMIPHIPIIFLLSVGADPTDSIIQLCRKRKCVMVATISMGEGQERPAMAAIKVAAAQGGWVLLQNCELGLGLMEQMEDIMVAYHEGPPENFNKDFRLFITAAPDANFPLGLLQMGTKVTNEPPSGMRAGLMRSYQTTVDQDRMERVDGDMWKRLLFIMCFLHSCVQERRKFGPLGWSIPYEYNLGDIEASLLFLEKHLYGGTVSWSTVQYMISEIQYGGKITDDLDRRLFNTYAAKWLNKSSLEEGFSFNPKVCLVELPGNFQYNVPTFKEQKEYQTYVATFPEIDSPELSGLHPNADLTFRVKEATSMMNALMETQPKTGGGGGAGGVAALTPEEIVHKRAGEMLTITPGAYLEDSVKLKIKSIGGMDNPLNIFLFQEIRVLSVVVDKVRLELSQLQLAIDGEVVMTEEYATIIDELFNAKVPKTWMFTATGIEYSWINSTVGLWMGNFGSRDAQIRSWLDNGRPSHFSCAGFFNPQGFLTSMKQEVTRRHRGEGWALDDMVYHTEVTDMISETAVRSGPKEGVYCSGLYLDGAAWSRMDGSLVESIPKQLFTLLPVLWVTATTKTIRKEKIKTGMYGPKGPYECPLYKYPARTDRFYVAIINMASKASDGIDEAPNSSHWILRGVALTATTDYM